MIYKDGNILLSPNSNHNIIENDGKFYPVVPLNENFPNSRGGNSAVFKLIDPNDEELEYAIKFSKFPNNRSYVKQNLRFQNEIDALNQAKEEGFENVIEIVFEGTLEINEESFHYFVMEKADDDLRAFLYREKIALNQKLVLCYEVIKGINQLHSLELYHRDIKPDNIFYVKGKWKVADLGLASYRNQNIDRKNEKIGPYGWLSPEVMNKVLCESTDFEKVHYCIIDKFSDIFQLGKLIWFILNGNIPIGQITFEDFIIKKKDIFDLIFKMLQYNRLRRGQLDDYEEAFELLIY